MGAPALHYEYDHKAGCAYCGTPAERHVRDYEMEHAGNSVPEEDESAEPPPSREFLRAMELEG